MKGFKSTKRVLLKIDFLKFIQSLEHSIKQRQKYTHALGFEVV